jgi:hypothetical protein
VPDEDDLDGRAHCYRPPACALVVALVALAPRISESLVRARARGLPPVIAERMEEEWLAELDALCSRLSRLAFAIALTLTRRHSFSTDDDLIAATASRPSATVGTIGGWPSVVIVATLSFAAFAYCASFLIQPMYRSAVQIRVVPSRMPAAFVEPTVGRPWQERLQRTSTQVLSQSNLERIIVDAHLYGVNQADGRDTAVSADLIERMRHDIDLRFLPEGESFEVGYRSPDRQVARTVVMRLMRLYARASFADRDATTGVARRALDAKIDAVRSQLLDRAATIRSMAGGGTRDLRVRKLEHEQLKSRYRELLLKREHFLTTTILEQRGFGENFQLLDSPDWPHIPISPNRHLIALEGAGAGFLLAIAMVLAGRTGSLQRVKKALARS